MAKLTDIEEAFAEHLFDTLREGFLVLDNDLRVQRVNSSYYRLFQVEPGKTKGKKLYELGNGQWNIPDLRELLEKILPEKKEINNYQIEHEFKEIGHRIMLLNARQLDHSQLILLAIEDVTDRKKAIRQVEEAKANLEEQVQERTRQVRRLASRLIESEQNERNRIADILHDNLQQKLFSIRMNLDLLQRQIDSESPGESLSEKISDALKKTDQAIDETRQLSSDLNPAVVKSSRLTEVLGWLIRRFDEMHNLKIDMQAEANFMIHEEEMRVVLLRVVRELLFNIVKHADVDRAVIQIEKSADRHMLIHVVDEGSGFDADHIDHKEHSGLFNIRERLNLVGGNLEIDSVQGKGTRMVVKMPIGESIATEKVH